MLPSLLFSALRQGLTATLLLLVIALSLLGLARHVILPLWPSAVEEQLVLDGEGEVSRHFVKDVTSNDQEYQLLTVSRPYSVLAVVTVEGELVHGFLSGLRNSSENGMLELPPDWLMGPVFLEVPPQDLEIVLTLANEDKLSLAFSDISHVYRPNAMNPIDRVQMTAWQLGKAWRWPPFSAIAWGDSLSHQPDRADSEMP